jgi:hypothetical protein
LVLNVLQPILTLKYPRFFTNGRRLETDCRLHGELPQKYSERGDVSEAEDSPLYLDKKPSVVDSVLKDDGSGFIRSFFKQVAHQIPVIA